MLRFRMAWVATVCLLTLIACCEFLFYATVTVAVVTLVLVGWLYLRRGFFDKPLAFPKFVPPWKIHTPQDGVPSNSELSGAAGALNPSDNQGATAAMLIEGSEAIRKSSSGSSLPQERE